MLDDPHRQKLHDLETRQVTLAEKLACLQQQHAPETREEE
ncbi:hypothetical protein SAMN05660964_00152 [Thiothrix caldifontis]|uniref:Uncharacterized protein n=1 Tax=Thiothrix caldifontis TaxID=525918 RepID=A0A1H3VLL9_9GAMM|nr:hypothetical protein SAMN05660964_00152 [Thiothrix caldifontis]